MTVVTGSYVLMSSALTLMLPYKDVRPTSAFADAFEQRGALWAKYVVAIGALSGMTTSLIGSLFALPRCVYAMAKDGLIFRSLAHVHPTTQVPTLAVAVFGAATSIIALLFDVETLVEFLSIGTLMAYTIPAKARPGVAPDAKPEGAQEIGAEEASGDKEILMEGDIAGQLKPQFAYLRPWTDRFEPGSLVGWAVASLVIFVIAVTAVMTYGDLLTWWGIFSSVVFGVGAIASVAVICIHHKNKEQLRFKVPLVPLIPVASIVINLVFMLHLSRMTWLRLGIWLLVGGLVYFLYGIKHSQENSKEGAQTTYNTLSAPSTPGAESVKFPDPSQASVTLEKHQPQPTKDET